MLQQWVVDVGFSQGSCKVAPKVEVNLADGEGARDEKGAKQLAGMLLADGRGVYYLTISLAFSPRQKAWWEGGRKM